MLHSTYKIERRRFQRVPLLLCVMWLTALGVLSSSSILAAEPAPEEIEVDPVGKVYIWSQPSEFSRITSAENSFSADATIEELPLTPFDDVLSTSIVGENETPVVFLLPPEELVAVEEPVASIESPILTSTPEAAFVPGPYSPTRYEENHVRSPEQVFRRMSAPNCCPRLELSFRDDVHDFFPMLWDDAKSVVTRENLVILGVALGGAIALRQDVDGEVRDYTRDHPRRWGSGSEFLGKMAEPQYQVPVLLGVYGWSLYHQDHELHDFSTALISAYTVTSLTTLAVKGIANTDRPSDTWNDGEYGFPSYHTSSSFAMAAVVEEYYGWKAGAPAYAVAGLIGWSRIDERDHDLSDVVFGAALGCVIGKTIAAKHLDEYENFTCYPYVDPVQGSTGMMFDCRF